MRKFLRKLFGRNTIQSTQDANSISSNSSVVNDEDDCELRFENDNKDEQTIDCNVYKNGQFSHTVTVCYFTTEQIERIKKAKKNLMDKNCQ